MTTLVDFIASQKKLILNKKLKLRELDEEFKGVYIAFVDEGKESYDVHISIDSNNELIKSECDCEHRKPCLHQVYLAQFIAEKKQIILDKSKRKSTKKIPEHHRLIDSIEEITLKNWLKNITDKNKALKFELMLQFNVNLFTLETVEQNLIDAIDSITNNRKKLNQSQINNLLNIFDKINKPIYDHIKDSKDVQASILLMILVTKTLNNHYNLIKSNSKKYEAYIENLFPMLNDSLIKAPIELYTSSIEIFIQKAKIDRSIKNRIYDYLYSLRDMVDMKKRLILMSNLNFIEKSNSYFSSQY